MADNSSLDIFATDLDVKDFIPKTDQISFSKQNKHIATDKNQAERQKVMMPIAKKQKWTKAKNKNLAVQNNWTTPVKPTITTDIKKNQPVKEGVKFEIKEANRPNLTVLKGKGAIKTPKPPISENQPNIPPKNMEKTVSNTTKNETEPKPQTSTSTSGVQGRMTASSFMNLDQPAPVATPSPASGIRAFPIRAPWMQSNYPKGIPKSFLTQQHQHQLETQPQAPAPPQYNNPHRVPSPNPEPVWEALPSKKPQTEVLQNWTGFKPRFDHLPTGQFENQVHYTESQDIGPTGQGSGPTTQGIGPNSQMPGPSGQSSGPMSHGYTQEDSVSSVHKEPMFVETEPNYHEEIIQQYSPSDAYADMGIPDTGELSDYSPDSQHSSSKRLSAFQRLGPVTQTKKPKLTINLTVGKEQAVREVVKDSKEPELEKYIPVLERPDIQTSLDDTVMKYLVFWPWTKPLIRRTLTARESKSIMQMELEQVESEYKRDKNFFGISVTGYPRWWSKEDVMDTVLEAVKGKTLIPCFIEFKENECKFLVIRSLTALVAIHKMGFTYRKDDVLLTLSIINIGISVNQIDFIPRLILRKRLSMCMEGETELNLKAFTLASDISHFLYFPLNRGTNQSELMQLQSSVPWNNLTKLNLSHNRISSLSSFDLPSYVPRLKHLDLSHNRLEGISTLLAIRVLPLSTIHLEGNPLCLDYIAQERYIKALKMIFPTLREIDGVKLTLPGEFPAFKRNFALQGSEEIASKVLETLFPLLDADCEERQLCEDLYMDDAVMTITYMYKLKYSALYKEHRSLFARARILDEGEMDQLNGALEISKLIYRWPKLEHDPLTFTVDVLYHTENTTMLRVSGVVKISAETLAEEEYFLYFTRTLVVHTLDSREYKIANEMIYWDFPIEEVAREAFRMTKGRSKILNLKLDGPPDSELRKKLLKIFMGITELDSRRSEKCLESKEWHLRNALEYFAKLLKLDNIDSLLD